MHAGQITDETQAEGPADQELVAWLGFADPACKGFGPARISKLKEHFGSFSQAWSADSNRLFNVPDLPSDVVSDFIEYRRTAKPERWFEVCCQQGIQIIPFKHPCYPDRLRHIFNAPEVLFWKGLPPSEFNLRLSLAIVGSRTPTVYGQKQSKDFAQAFANLGITIVSGMADGIDTSAHLGAIEGGGKTIAVLGSGVDICYPQGNRHLYEKLISGSCGAVISEYFPGIEPEQFRFPERNRIISGICPGVLVVEAGEHSGALITVKLALEQGREVFALPGRVDSSVSKGTNNLLREGANWVQSYQDVLGHLGVAYSGDLEKPAIMELYGREKEVYNLLSSEPINFDSLIEQTGMPVGELSATLTMLELGGTIKRVPGDAYVKA